MKEELEKMPVICRCGAEMVKVKAVTDAALISQTTVLFITASVKRRTSVQRAVTSIAANPRRLTHTTAQRAAKTQR